MKEQGDETNGADTGLHGQKPALQVICLGAGGGPCEDNVTSFLVRSTASSWAKGSLAAVDAGSHLAPITRILERDFPAVSGDKAKAYANGDAGNGNANRHATPEPDDGEPPKPEPTLLTSGPFAGLTLPHESARANALHLLRTYISTYLITHPHLDHVSGFIVNTAAFHATSRPKTLAALPSTVEALKQHIFNDVIWPNLTDEDGGVGFVTFQRLKEGGDVMLGEGEGRGYIDICDGLGVRALKVSHGTCTKGPPAHHHRGSNAGIVDGLPPYNGSTQDHAPGAFHRSFSMSYQNSGPATPGGSRQSFGHTQASPHMNPAEGGNSCVVDSTAFFVRDSDTQREVLIFGDVEPDSLSLSPRTYLVWQEAARKIALGLLGGIFIESSYDDSQADAILFGHLNPRHLIAELQNLAAMASEAKAVLIHEKSGGSAKKRKRSEPNGLGPDHFARAPPHAAAPDAKRSRSSLASRTLLAASERRRSSGTSLAEASGPASPKSAAVGATEYHPYDPHAETGPNSPAYKTSLARPSSVGGGMPLAGIKVVVIHVKDTFKDGPHVGERILAQLGEYEARLQADGQGLGCEFVVSRSGESYWF